MQRYLRNIDWWLVGAVCALVGIGLMLIASATHSYAVARGEAVFVERQGIFFGINVLLVIFCLRFDYRLLQQIAKPLYIFNLVLLLAVMFVGHSAVGAQRWIQIGPVTIQPSEFAKMAVILFLPWVMEHTKGRSDSLWFMTKAVLCTLPIAALVGSNNLSTAIILLGICAFLIFISHPGYLPFLGIGGAGIGFIAVFLMMESYRLERLAIWRDPEKYEKGFQTIQGLYAIGSGGIFGRGMGNSLQKLGFVPEAQNDIPSSVRKQDCLELYWLSFCLEA